MRTIDCHVHYYPPEVTGNPAAWAAAAGEPAWGGLVSPHPGRHAIQGWASAGRMLADMDAAGVGHAVLQGWYWENQLNCTAQNAWHAELAAAYPGRLSWFATVQPREGRPALDEAVRAADAGCRGFGELCPHAQGHAPDDPWFARILDLAGERSLPVLLHVSDPQGRPYPGRVETPLQDFLDMAERHPRTTFILAHWGGLLPLRIPAMAARLPGNIYFDTAASPLIYRRDVFRRVLDAIGLERILHGSDYPLVVFPRETSEPDFARYLQFIRSAGLTGTELDAIMGGNAARLLGIGGPDRQKSAS